jgi:hypothetical protein
MYWAIKWLDLKKDLLNRKDWSIKFTPWPRDSEDKRLISKSFNDYQQPNRSTL